MQIGMTLPTMVPGLDRAALLEWARRIDAGPFSTLAAGERIAYPNQEILVSLAAAAAVTERVRIATTVTVLPLHATGLIAKQLATLDVISGGRLVVGVGVGGREEDYRAAGASFERRLARMETQVGLLRRLWSGEAAIDGVGPIGPPPLRAGGPEILAASLSAGSIRRAARWADGLCGFGFAPDAAETRAAFELAREAWGAAGRPAPRLVTSFWYGIGAGARARMDEFVRSYLGFLGAETAAAIASTCRAVSEQALLEVLAEIEEAGADECLLVPIDPDLGRLERVAELMASRGSA